MYMYILKSYPFITSPRTLYVAARENQFPEVLSYVNAKRLTPIPCIIFTVTNFSSNTLFDLNIFYCPYQYGSKQKGGGGVLR